MKTFLVLFLFSLILPLLRAQQVFQYHTETLDKKERPKSVFLWVPPEAEPVRGILASTQTLMEAHMSVDPDVRAVCRKQGIAILFSKTGLPKENLKAVLQEFAEQSGFRELTTAPLFFVGHSAGGGWANQMAKEFPDRCFGLMTFRGGLPWGASPEIPSLVMVGQYDEFGGRMRTAEGFEAAWENPVKGLADMLERTPQARFSLVVEPGTGHFAWSEKNARLFASFLEVCAEKQLGNDGKITRIPYDQGWSLPLTPRTFSEEEPVPAGTDQTRPLNGSWFPSRELAEKALNFHQGLTGKKDQFIRWQNRHWVDAGARFFFMGLQFEPGTAVFHTNPVYADAVPGQYDGKGPVWHHAGEAVGNSGEPIRVIPIAGPMEEAGDGKLRIRYSTLFPQGERNRYTFLAISPGNDTFRHTEQVGMAPRGYKGIRKGKPQTISFPDVPETITADSDPLVLGATSDSGLPVEYYVAYGPGVIQNATLVIKDVHVMARSPIELKIVATQPGSGKDPGIRQAEKVEQVIQVINPWIRTE